MLLTTKLSVKFVMQSTFFSKLSAAIGISAEAVIPCVMILNPYLSATFS